jgi:DNA-binding HxlR family transcriptional regulator
MTPIDSEPRTSAGGGSRQGGGIVDGEQPEFQFRAGGRVLALFSAALHGLVLKALEDGPLRLAELRRRVGGPPQTTLRGHLGNLIGMGALEKRSRDGAPNMVDNALTPVGLELLFVADVLERWLSRCPAGPLDLEREGGKGAVKAFAGGWNSAMLRALAVRPFSLTELDTLISAFSYPALERRLSAMHLSGLVRATQGERNGTPYAVTEWLRLAVAPLLASIRCERRQMPAETAPLGRIDVEAAFLLAVPLVSPPTGAGGACQLTVEDGADSRWREAGVAVAVERGEVVSCSSRLEPKPATAVRGPALAWLEALVGGDAGELEIGGDRELALGLVDGLHAALFPA